MSMRTDAQTIINAAIRDVLPDTAAAKALDGYTFAPGRVRLSAAGGISIYNDASVVLVCK